MKKTQKPFPRNALTKKLAMQLREANSKIKHMETHDRLTNLPNLALFQNQIKQIVESPTKPTYGAILLLDFDNFSHINALFGYHSGDKLLQDIVLRITPHLQEKDLFARKGSDKFILYLFTSQTHHDITERTISLIKALKLPFIIKDEPIFLTTSIGISLYPTDTDDLELLLRYAENANCEAKNQGKNNYQYFNHKNNKNINYIRQIDAQLHQAINQNQFFLCYQPQIDIEKQTLIGMEALLRWQHPQLGMISPADFIPVAEKNRLIFPISDWVLLQACKQMSYWDLSDKPIQIAINLSALEFKSTEEPHLLVNRIKHVLEESNLSPTHLELEITESSIIQHYTQVIPTIKALRNLGVRIACDDFGTGYSSLSYLKHLPIDTLKIDKSFLNDLSWDNNDVAIIRAILTLAKQFGIRVIAEGVETELQMNILQDLGCSLVQGFYLSKPLLPEDIPNLVVGKTTKLK